MTLKISVIFIVFFVASVIIDIIQNVKFKEKLNVQNLDIILGNHDKIDVKAELFKEKDFFKLVNTGKSPSEIRKIDFIRYSKNEDYFLKIR